MEGALERETVGPRFGECYGKGQVEYGIGVKLRLNVHSRWINIRSIKLSIKYALN